MAGWIKLHRKILDSPVFDNPDLFKMWSWCLLKASHRDYEQMVGLDTLKLCKGSFVTGRSRGSEELKVNPSTWYRYLKLLEKYDMIELESNNKMTIVKIVNWEIYQGNGEEVKKEPKKEVKKESRQEVDRVVIEYKEKLSMLSQPRKITNKRKQHIQARVDDFGIDNVMSVINKVSESSFLQGENDRGWKADIDWIFNPNNFVKILEDKYSDNKGTGNRLGIETNKSNLGKRRDDW